MPHPARNRHPAEQIPTAVSETTAVRRARQGRKGAPQETVVDITQRSESERRRLLAHGAAAAETPAKTGRSPATVVIYDGIRFASTGEGKRYLELRAAQERGEISDLRCHPDFLLDEAFVDNDGTAYGLCRYTADFIYRQRDGGVWAVEDFKGWKGLDK